VLRVGLTGGLGSGKSTAASMFAAHGAYVFSADELGRELMQPGQRVYAAIVARFGAAVVKSDGTLDRTELARIAFGPATEGGGRVEELNAIVHPATIARQAELIEEVRARDPNAVTIVESALIFETKHGGEGGWQNRFDKIIFIRVPEEVQIARFVERSLQGQTAEGGERASLESQARQRLAQQSARERNAERCDYVLTNDGSVEDLSGQVDALWPKLKELAKCG
jgi:dephospho-CoA kinase